MINNVTNIFYSSQASSSNVHEIDSKSQIEQQKKKGNVLHDKSPLGTNILGNIFVKKGKKSGKY